MEEKWRIDNRSLMLGMLVLCTLVVLSPVFEPASAYRASNYGMSDDRINTYPFIEHAVQKQESMGYVAFKSFNGRADLAFERLPGDQVFYFSGHGSPGSIMFGLTNTYIHGTNGQNSISSFTSGELNDLALAVFVACNSGATDSTSGNLLTESTSKGVDCAIGFNEEINVKKAKYWSDRFWDYLDEGKTVQEAAESAKNDSIKEFIFIGGLGSHIIKGNSNLRIDPATAGA